VLKSHRHPDKTVIITLIKTYFYLWLFIIIIAAEKLWSGKEVDNSTKKRRG